MERITSDELEVSICTLHAVKDCREVEGPVVFVVAAFESPCNFGDHLGVRFDAGVRIASVDQGEVFENFGCQCSSASLRLRFKEFYRNSEMFR